MIFGCVCFFMIIWNVVGIGEKEETCLSLHTELESSLLRRLVFKCSSECVRYWVILIL